MKILYDTTKMKSEFSDPVNGDEKMTTQKINNFFDGAYKQFSLDQISDLERINKEHFELINSMIENAKEIKLQSN